MKHPATKLAFRLLQWGVLLAILAYLFYGIATNGSWKDLRFDPRKWYLLAGATVVSLLGVTITIVRWHWLMRALDLPIQLRESLRLGFLGYLFNFISLGAVGGDLFKAVFVARDLHGHRPEAVATVVVDRVIGLYGVLVLATASILATGAWHAEAVSFVRDWYKIVFIFTGAATLGASLLLLPDALWGAIARGFARIPKISSICERLLGAVRMYRRRLGILTVSLIVTLLAQAMFAVAFWLLAAGMMEHPPSLASHMVMVPMATLTGLIPMPLNAVGVVEGAYAVMYQNIPQAIEGASYIVPTAGVGTLVSLGNRIVQLLVAVVGVIFYLTSRREVAEVMHEVEVEAERGEGLMSNDECLKKHE